MGRESFWYRRGIAIDVSAMVVAFVLVFVSSKISGDSAGAGAARLTLNTIAVFGVLFIRQLTSGAEVDWVFAQWEQSIDNRLKDLT